MPEGSDDNSAADKQKSPINEQENRHDGDE
jgi:hypothetical protein